MSLASPQIDLKKTLRRWDMRRRLVQSLIWLPRGLLAGIIIALIVSLLSRWRPLLLPEEIMPIALGAVAAGGFLTLAAVWLRPRSQLWLARHFDRQFALKERLSTALEISDGFIPAPEVLASYQLNDTRQAITRVDLREKLPFKLNWLDWALLLIALIFLGITLYLENPFADQIVQQRQVNQAVQQQAEEVERIREQILENEALTAEQREELVQPLEEALDTLEQPEISREEAVAALSEAEQQIQEYADGLTEAEEQALERAGDQMNAGAATDAGDALSEQNPGEAAREMEELGESVANGELSQEEMDSLANQMEAAADSLESTNPEAAQSMREAAEALRDGDQQAAQQAMNQAAEALRDQQQQAANRPQAQQAQQAQQQLQQSRQEMAQAGQQNQSQQGQQSEQQQPSDSQSSESQQSEGQQGQPSDQGQPSQPGQEGQPGSDGDPQQPGQEGSESQPGENGQPSEQEGGQSSSSESGAQSESDQQGAPQPGTAQGGAGEDTTQGTEGGEEGVRGDVRPGEETDLNEFDQVYAPSRIGETGQDNEVQLESNPQTEDGEDIREGEYNEAFDAASYAQYSDVYADYRNSVNEALETEYIPLGMRDVIHQYFTSLEP